MKIVLFSLKVSRRHISDKVNGNNREKWIGERKLREDGRIGRGR